MERIHHSQAECCSPVAPALWKLRGELFEVYSQPELHKQAGRQAGIYTGTGLESRSPFSASWPLSRDHLPCLKTGVTVTVSQGTSVLVSKPHLFTEAARNGAVAAEAATEAVTPLVCLGTAIGALSGWALVPLLLPW